MRFMDCGGRGRTASGDTALRNPLAQPLLFRHRNFKSVKICACLAYRFLSNLASSNPFGWAQWVR